MIDEEYISKEEALKKGYRRRRGGGLYKPSVLEKYLENGDLSCKTVRLAPKTVNEPENIWQRIFI